MDIDFVDNYFLQARPKMGIISLITLNEKESHLHCGKNSLTGSFGWFLQTLLASLAFTCLILKRWCEPSSERRPWKIWWYDTSKQGLGALVIHMINIVLSENFDGDPCTWYIINFLLDSSIGLFMVYIGIRAAQYLADIKHWESIRFGEYGKPPSANAWIIQCVLYVLLMMFVKLVITLIMRFKFWEQVREFVLSPIPNPLMELILVILIIPLVVNVLIFWVTDNFLMKHNSASRPNLIHRIRVHYKKLNTNEFESESDSVLSGDDEMLTISPRPSPSRELAIN